MALFSNASTTNESVDASSAATTPKTLGMRIRRFRERSVERRREASLERSSNPNSHASGPSSPFAFRKRLTLRKTKSFHNQLEKHQQESSSKDDSITADKLPANSGDAGTVTTEEHSESLVSSPSPRSPFRFRNRGVSRTLSADSASLSSVPSLNSQYNPPDSPMPRYFSNKKHSKKSTRSSRRKGATQPSSDEKNNHKKRHGRHVSFSNDPPVIHETPSMSDKELSKTFWSAKEIRKMTRRAQKLATDVAFKQDRHVLTCIHFCYGFDAEPLIISSSTSSRRFSGLTHERALHYYFHFETSDPKDPTVRGLERQMSSAIANYQSQCIQAVLTVQDMIRREGWTQRQMVMALSKQSSQASSQARRFARLLGKGDAAVVGNRTSGRQLQQQQKRKK